MARKAPTVSEATHGLVDSLGDLAAAAGRWLSLQPASRGMPVSAQNAAAWAEQTGARALETGQRAAAATRTAVVNLVILGLLLWWIDRLLRRS